MSLIEPYYNKSSNDFNLGYPDFKDDIRWKGVLRVATEKKKKAADAMVIVTKQRIYFFDQKERKVPQRHSHLFDIDSIEIPSNSKIILTFNVGKKQKKAIFDEQNALEMVRAIRTSIRDTTCNSDETMVIRISDFNNTTKPNEPFNLSPSSALAEAYLSECSRYNDLPSKNHVYYLERLSVGKEFLFNFSDIPGVCDAKSTLSYNLSHAFSALAYTNNFTHIKLNHVAIPGIDKALATFLRRNGCIRVL